MSNSLKKFLKIQKRELVKIRKSQNKVMSAMANLLKECESKK